MNFQDLKEQILENLKTNWQNFQETSLYVTLKEKFDDLSPRNQKIIMTVSLFLFIYILLSLPIAWIQSKGSEVTYFEEKRNLTRDLLHLNQEMATAPDARPEVHPPAIANQLQSILQGANVPPDQIINIEQLQDATIGDSRMIPKGIKQEGVLATLSQLTLRQIVDIGFRIENGIEGTKLTSIDIKASNEDSHYYDVMYRIVSFLSSIPPEPPARKGRKGRKRK